MSLRFQFKILVWAGFFSPKNLTEKSLLQSNYISEADNERTFDDFWICLGPNECMKSDEGLRSVGVLRPPHPLNGAQH